MRDADEPAPPPPLTHAATWVSVPVPGRLGRYTLLLACGLDLLDADEREHDYLVDPAPVDVTCPDCAREMRLRP